MQSEKDYEREKAELLHIEFSAFAVVKNVSFSS